MSSKFVQTFLHCPRPGLVWLFQTLRCEQRIQWQCSAPTVLRLVLPGVLWQLTTALLLGAFAKVLSVSQLPKGSKSPIIRHHPFFSAKKKQQNMSEWYGSFDLALANWRVHLKNHFGPFGSLIPLANQHPNLAQHFAAILSHRHSLQRCKWSHSSPNASGSLATCWLRQGVSM